MSGRRRTTSPARQPVSQDEQDEQEPVTPIAPIDYKELLRHLNTQGHIVVLKLHVPERPKPTWGQLLLRRPPVVHDNVLYKEDIRDLMYELENAIKTKTMIPDYASKKLKSINTMLHEIKPRGSQPPAAGSSASDVSSQQQQSDQPPTHDEDEDNWLTRTMRRARHRNWKEEEETQKRINAQAKWENDNSALALRLAADNLKRDDDLAKLDNKKLLEEFQVYKSKGGLLDLEDWLRKIDTPRLPNMTTPGDANKTQFGILYAKLANKLANMSAGGKSKRILKSRSKRSKRCTSNKGKKSHRRR